MQYKCEVCHDSGSKNQTGDYLDCPACDMPHTRKALNDFVKSLGPTHPEDVALAIHQRALAMAPKQEAPVLLMQHAAAWESLRADVLHGVDGLDNDQVNTVLGMIDHYMPGTDDAAPAAANGALTDEQIKEVAIDYASHVAGDVYDVTKYDCPEDFFNCVRAIVAAAGPNAAPIIDLTDAQLDELQEQSYNRNQSMKADIYAFGRACYRAALSGAKGN